MAPNLLGTSALFLAEATATPNTFSMGKKHLTPTEECNSVSKADCEDVSSSIGGKPNYKWDIVWRNVIAMVYLHVFSVYGIYLMFSAAQLKTSLLAHLLIILSGQGITSGAHRLWAHRSYKARLPLRIILAFCQTMAFQNHIYEWVRDHRVHHKFTETDADPHNSLRGFFFSHVGWLLVRKHKDVFVKGKTVDMSDLEADSVVRFQRKYYLILMPLVSFIIPCFIPWYFWGEDPWTTWYVIGVYRYVLSLNGTWLVNSAAHIYGNKPFDKTIGPCENRFVSLVAMGEGWHNYHHVFPWDYKAAELGYDLNFSTSVINMFARLGWAYDLKTVSHDMIRKREARTGDGSWRGREAAHQDDDGLKAKKAVRMDSNVSQGQGHHHHGNPEENVWGWGDTDMSTDDIQDVKIYNKLTDA